MLESLPLGRRLVEVFIVVDLEEVNDLAVGLRYSSANGHAKCSTDVRCHGAQCEMTLRMDERTSAEISSWNGMRTHQELNDEREDE